MAEQIWEAKLTCCVCIDVLECASAPHWVALPCGHTLHELCWAQSVEHKAQCPKCRAPVKGRDQRGVRLWVESTVSKEEAAGAAGGHAAHGPAAAAAGAAGDAACSSLYRAQEQELKARVKELNEEVGQLLVQQSDMQKQQQAQAEQVKNLKAQLKGERLNAKMEAASLQDKVQQQEQLVRGLQDRLADEKKRLEEVNTQLATARAELQQLKTKALFYERNIMVNKLAQSPNLTEQQLRHLCNMPDTGKLDSEVVVRALAAVNQQLLEEQHKVQAAKAAQQQAELDAESRIAAIRREADTRVAAHKAECDRYRLEASRMEYEKVQLESRLQDAGMDLGPAAGMVLPVTGQPKPTRPPPSSTAPAATQPILLPPPRTAAVLPSQGAAGAGLSPTCSALGAAAGSDTTSLVDLTGPSPPSSTHAAQQLCNTCSQPPGTAAAGSARVDPASHAPVPHQIGERQPMQPALSAGNQVPAGRRVPGTAGTATTPWVAPQRQLPGLPRLGGGSLSAAAFEEGAAGKRKAGPGLLNDMFVKRRPTPQQDAPPASATSPVPSMKRPALAAAGDSSFVRKPSLGAMGGQPLQALSNNVQTFCSLDVAGGLTGLSAKPAGRKPGTLGSGGRGSRGTQASIESFLPSRRQ